jgi:hypothetical protein
VGVVNLDPEQEQDFTEAVEELRGVAGIRRVCLVRL